MDQTGIKPGVLARESGYSRQHLLRLRKGTMEPTRAAMVRIAQACGHRLARHVHVWEVFDIGEDGPAPVRTAPPVLRLAPRWSARLREAIRASGKTQSEIARIAGIPEETVSRLVTGQSGNPKLETVFCIAHALGTTVGWLLEERGYSLSADNVRQLGDVVAVILNVTGLNPLLLKYE